MMRRCARILILAWVVLAAGCVVVPASEPAGGPAAIGSGAAAPSSGTPGSASSEGIASPRAGQTASNMRLVGALELAPSSGFAFGDLAVYADHAFIGRMSWTCPDHGIDIIDIADPAKPRVIATTEPVLGAATEDLQAARIGDRDVLVAGLQNCTAGVPDTSGRNGIDLWDIGDPQRPSRLATFTTELGVHEFGLAGLADGRTLALLAVPDLEATSLAGGQGSGDLLIVDISDPQHPELIGEWGVLDEPMLGRAAASNANSGAFPGVFLHSVRASADGRRAFLSYWDAGVIVLDIADPSQPRYIGRIKHQPGDEGNAHSVAVSPDGRLLVQADEDIHPKNLVLRSGAFDGEQTVLPLGLSYAANGAPLRGTVTPFGRGCSAEGGSSPAQQSPDVAGKVALIEAGDCMFDEKIVAAQEAGASGAILYATDALTMPVDVYAPPTTTYRDGKLVNLTIPSVYAHWATASALLASTEPVTVESGLRFDGWGGVRLFDVSVPESPTPLSTFATRFASDGTHDAFADSGPWWTAHDPFLDGTTLYVSWYSDGVRVLDVADPRAPREIGHWAGLGAPAAAPPVFIWGAVAHNGLVFAGDINYGLYILELEG